MVKISAHKRPSWVIIGCALFAGSGVLVYCTLLWISLGHETALSVGAVVGVAGIMLFVYNVAVIRNATTYFLILFFLSPFGIPAFAFGFGIAVYNGYYSSIAGAFFAFTFIISTYFAIQRGVHADIERFLISGLGSGLIQMDVDHLNFYTIPEKNRPAPTSNDVIDAKFSLSWLDGAISNFALLLGCVALPFSQKAVYVDQMARHENPVPLAFVFAMFFFYLYIGRLYLSKSIAIFRLDQAIKSGDIRPDEFARGWGRGGIRRPN